jgi:hypothetical protein
VVDIVLAAMVRDRAIYTWRRCVHLPEQCVHLLRK